MSDTQIYLFDDGVYPNLQYRLSSHCIQWCAYPRERAMHRLTDLYIHPLNHLSHDRSHFRPGFEWFWSTIVLPTIQPRKAAMMRLARLLAFHTLLLNWQYPNISASTRMMAASRGSSPRLKGAKRKPIPTAVTSCSLSERPRSILSPKYIGVVSSIFDSLLHVFSYCIDIALHREHSLISR